MIHEGAAVLSGVGTLTAFGDTSSGQASLSGSGTLTTIGGLIWYGAASPSGVGTLTVRGLIPFTHEMMAEVVIEIDDREIHNDIRSEVDVTEYHEDETPAVYESGKVTSERFTLWGNSQQTITLNAPRSVSSWLPPYADNVDSWATWDSGTQSNCENHGGTWDGSMCWYVKNARSISIMISARTDTSITLRVANSIAPWVNIAVVAPYRYMLSDSYVTTRTEQYTLKVRSTDSSSIAKYGRRVMNLTWPLGQTEEQMKQIVDTYLLRYKEPMAHMKVTLLGINDTMINKILHTHISDKIWVDDATIGVVDYFFVNAMSTEHHVSGLLEATWDLELIRDYEKATYWTWDESRWDTGPVWAP